MFKFFELSKSQHGFRAARCRALDEQKTRPFPNPDAFFQHLRNTALYRTITLTVSSKSDTSIAVAAVYCP